MSINLSFRKCVRCPQPLAIGASSRIRFCPTCKSEKIKEHHVARNKKLRLQAAALVDCNHTLRNRLSTLVTTSHTKAALVLGITAETVRQTELKAINKLRGLLDPYRRNDGSKDFLNVQLTTRKENVTKSKCPLYEEGLRLVADLREYAADLTEAGDHDSAREVMAEITACETQMQKL